MKEFTVNVKMQERWIPIFLGFLKTMQTLGSVGASRSLTFYCDGDGDFGPKFEFDESLPVKEYHPKDEGGLIEIKYKYPTFDAG